MTTKNPMQLKALIKKKAEEVNLPSQLVLQNYIMERLLERISLSEFRRNIVLKGGFLIAAIVGLDSRATMDLDATVKGLPMTNESIRSIFDEVCTIALEDNIEFNVSRITDIREGGDYPGLRVSLIANFPPLAIPLSVDVTTGDKITPSEIEYSVRLMFDDRSISLMGYNLETILAEKLETVLSRNITNTRPRDFYDIHLLYAMRSSECNIAVLKQALEETASSRGSLTIMERYRKTVADILESPQMQGFWKKYRDDYEYAKDVEFAETCATILRIMEVLTIQ